MQTGVVNCTFAARGCSHWELCHRFNSVEMSHLLKKSASSASSLFSHCGTKLCLTYSVCWPWCPRNGWMLGFRHCFPVPHPQRSPRFPLQLTLQQWWWLGQNGERKFLRICIPVLAWPCWPLGDEPRTERRVRIDLFLFPKHVPHSVE